MIRERDFSKVTLKVNASGSWANVCFLSVENYDKVKAAVEVLASAHQGSVTYRILDAEGGCIEAYGRYKQGGNSVIGWHVPSR